MEALTSKTFYNVDAFGNLTLFTWKFAAALAVAYLSISFINKHLYNKRFRDVEGIMARLKEFEKGS